MRMPVGGLLVNRAFPVGAEAAAGEWLRDLIYVSRGAPLFVAPALQGGPAGPQSLRSFISGWRALEPDVPVDS